MLPEAFTKRMKTLLAEEYGAFLDSFSRPRAVALRLNPLKTQAPPDLSGFSLRPVPWEPCGFYYDPETRPGKSAYHEAGLYYLQEASAMAPAALLDPQPGERVLDLCAAPGGKSTQLAGKMRGRGLLVCNEINPKRAKILASNIERLGIANALVLNEHPQRLEARFAGWFDRILVDAPCSGEGMFRKEEAAVTDWSEETVLMCARRQALDEFIDTQNDAALFDGIEADTLRDRFVVTLEDNSLITQTKEMLKQIDGVDEVSAHDEIANGFQTVQKVLNIAAMVIIVVLFVVSMFIISNTIKLAMYSRSQEIAIMKMVGATNSFIRLPFVVEGLILGFISSLVAFFLEWGLYDFLASKIAQIDTLQLITIVPFAECIEFVAIAYAITGFVVGVFGSMLSIRKFLRV